MNDHQNLGRRVSALLYFAEGLFLIGAMIWKNAFSEGYAVALLGFWICSILGVFIFGREKYIAFFTYEVLLYSLSTFVGFGICYITDDVYIIFFVFAAQWVLAGLCLNTKLCRTTMVLDIVFVCCMTFLPVRWLDSRLTMFEFLFVVALIISIDVISSSLIKILQFHERRSVEQERSLDDQLKLVEVMCEEAKSAARSKSEFLSNMSHEIRTPINAILGMNEMILRENRDEQIAEYAVNIENSGNMLLSLINDILDFSKIESGKMEIIPGEYQMSSVLNDLVNIISPRAQKKGLKLQVETQEDLPEYLYGDEVRIRQIITNLLTNAVKYTDAGTITLKVGCNFLEGKNIMLFVSVKDTGRGIKQEDIPKLFHTFQRLNQKENRNIEGTGLGLAITGKFVYMMNGTIGVNSEYGVGSDFYVSIPQKVTRTERMGDFKTQYERSVKQREHYEESFTAPEAKVLVVDDNQMNISVVKMLLKKTGIQLTEAGSGAEAVEAAKKEQFDLILLDHMMPNMDGVETLQKLKELELLDHTPVIALTANAVSGAKDMYLDYGFSDYLSKPIAGKTLEKCLIGWLPDTLVQRNQRSDTVVLEQMQDQTDSVLRKPEIQPAHSDADELPELEEFDWEYAMRYFPDKKQLTATIKIAYMNMDQEMLQLDNLMQNIDNRNNLAQYRTQVHALKSTMASIGALLLSKLARLLEIAAEEHDIGRIKGMHPVFIEEMQKHKARMAALVQRNQGETRKMNAEQLKETLVHLKAALEEWEFDIADKLVEELQQYTFDEYTAGKMQKIFALVQNVQAQEAAEIIKEIIGDKKDEDDFTH